MRRLGRRQIDAGIHFLVPCGTTGENPTLTDAERVRIVEILVDEWPGKVPILAGAGGYDTREVIHLAELMRKAGATGLLSVTPYYNKPTQEGLYQHYKAIADSTAAADHCLQRAGPDRRQRRDRDACCALADAAEHHRREGSVGQHQPDGRSLPRRAGGLHRPLGRRCDHAAADGDRRTRRHLGGLEREFRPRWCAWSTAAERGDFAAARAMHHRMLPLMQINFVEANPLPVKSAMAVMGLLEEVYRLPMCPPSAGSKERIAAC